MAPKRGGGGSSSFGSGSSPTCPDAFITTEEQAYFANDVVFFAAMLCIAIALCSFRKKSVPGKQLIGLPFIGVILFFLLTSGLSIIGTVLQQCDTADFETYININIVVTIFNLIACWLLLFVVVYTLNTMLQRQLDRSNAIFKIIPAVLVGIMGLLTAGHLGLRAYLNAYQKTNDYFDDRTKYRELVLSSQRLLLAYYVLYFITILASGALALMTILSLRKARKAAGDLIGWSVALTLAMVLWVVIPIVFASWYFQEVDYETETQIALGYVLNFGQVISCIFILCIAKHASWRNIGAHEQYGQNGNTNGQPYYYHQAPEFVGNTHQVKP